MNPSLAKTCSEHVQGRSAITYKQQTIIDLQSNFILERPMQARSFPYTCGCICVFKWVYFSALMPSLEMLPFIQCHHTRGRALAGGFSNPLLSGSDWSCALAVTISAPTAIMSAPAQISLLIGRFISAYLTLETSKLYFPAARVYPAAPPISDAFASSLVLKDLPFSL